MIAVWQSELSSAAGPSNSSKIPWGYFVPEVALMVAPTRDDTRKMCFMNWLKLRSAWRYILDDIKLRALYPANQWRTFLRSSAPKDVKILDNLKKSWGITITDVLSNKVTWRGVELTESMLDDTMCKEVTWDLCRLGFRYELLTVDSIIVRRTTISLDEAALRLRWINDVVGSTTLTDTVTNTGISAADVTERAKALLALRELMRRWPNVPAEIQDVVISPNSTEPSEVVAFERAIARFYILTFVRHSGRAPVLPRCI